ncbi:MAG: hypothetical protein ACT4RN_01385 [Pseudonocardia sp.]
MSPARATSQQAAEDVHEPAVETTVDPAGPSDVHPDAPPGLFRRFVAVAGGACRECVPF